MFLILLTFVKPLSEVEKYIDQHVDFLDKNYANKKFIFSGRKAPRTGGVILAYNCSEEEVRELIAQDPFYKHQIANFEVINFQPTKYDKRFEPFLNEQE
ncbi:uncharacterized protein YciI [Pontibacter ummariensis]|uniref:Uncharacterized conserved protein YciI, contains a putative active-site phosphohistidine n=1 Tax=Pontibacter ummariensis TaxID=1610492 RepID=A0A239CWI6_9BACT|nr:YciI family protein [Pontibacter ummariensis]PRY14787.1 uncharacterized protein YciI [Pontibacter ummariensis]SNS24470.1 Uncharacterized conserved protein YciI, contains a putative active-site phosphohistidine [Pontibacter ummariensis]